MAHKLVLLHIPDVEQRVLFAPYVYITPEWYERYDLTNYLCAKSYGGEAGSLLMGYAALDTGLALFVAGGFLVAEKETTLL